MVTPKKPPWASGGREPSKRRKEATGLEASGPLWVRLMPCGTWTSTNLPFTTPAEEAWGSLNQARYSSSECFLLNSTSMASTMGAVE